MKYCSCCHQKKPLSEFNKDKSRKDGYYIYCRECSHKKQKESLSKKEERIIAKADKVIGGYKISILNHASRTEKLYNIESTEGNYYGTNEKLEFFNYLRGILNDR